MRYKEEQDEATEVEADGLCQWRLKRSIVASSRQTRKYAFEKGDDAMLGACGDRPSFGASDNLMVPRFPNPITGRCWINSQRSDSVERSRKRETNVNTFDNTSMALHTVRFRSVRTSVGVT